MSDLTVATQAGKVCGEKVNAYDGTEYFSFKGIPYAEPPVGELRFRDPQPLKPWTGIRDAKSHGPKCGHKDYYSNEIMGSDDCLYLNVYARHIDSKQRWPVMVWIHGGAFIGGTGDDCFFGPDFFMRKDVVLVTTNYRLGVLGFLNLDDELAAGNQGLKDQVMALQWVRDNIANFGGDLNNVTIFGESAGGASVHYLTISPLAKGLFHKAIPMSGVVQNSWAYHSNLKEKAYRLCERLGHTEKDAKSIINFLKTVDTHKLIEAQEDIVTNEEKIQFVFSFGPSIDSKSKKPFMPVHPDEAAANGIKVPVMIGYTSREGICFMQEKSENLKNFNPKTEEILPPNLREIFKKYYNLNSKDLLRIYFNDEPITNLSLEKLADFAGDLYLIEGIQRAVNTQVEKNYSPTYLYQFTYDKEPSITKVLGKINMSGASHGDELAFLFRPRMFEDKMGLPKKGSVKHKLMEQMIEMWVNFATAGNPTPKVSELLPVKWLPVDDKSGVSYLNICEDLRMEVAIGIDEQYIARKYPKNVA